ncbi:MAG: hypothetical protein M3032_10515 [Verrucomicrobiota bacterium]|nr:hypothetical protein [Verrucomicrobiota bacterium]
MRRPRVIFAIAALVCASALAQELPTHEGEEQALEIDPPLLIQARNADGSLVLAGPAATPAPPADITKLEKDLTRAKRGASGAEGLYRAGIISKVEAEERALRVVRLEAKLAEAKLQVAKQDVAQPAEEPAAPPASVAEAEAAAARAAAERRRAELEAALRNLQRQQKLLALGSGRKADVNRAEQKVAELQHAGE